VSSSAIAIRVVETLEPALVEALGALLADVVGQGASVGFLSPLTPADARAYWSGVLQPHVTLLIAEQGGRLVGTAQLHAALQPNARHRAEVCKLMVHPAAQRRGIARALMERLEGVAKAAARTLLVLDTRSGDVSSDLYRSMGYVEVGRIPRYARSSSGQLDSTVLFYKELG
jgi:ribosomal protein S18 acetylase RimI-like enzyme